MTHETLPPLNPWEEEIAASSPPLASAEQAEAELRAEGIDPHELARRLWERCKARLEKPSSPPDDQLMMRK